MINLKCVSAKKTVNLKAPISENQPTSFKERKHCPVCGSTSVYARLIVSGYAEVNVNTLELREHPEECDCCWSDVQDASEFTCMTCDHEWSKEEDCP
jgi:hypothetical protein